MSTKQLYIEEPVSNLPKEEGIYAVKFPDGEITSADYDPAFGFHAADFNCNTITHWLRPVPREEEATRMLDIAKWANSNSIFWNGFAKSWYSTVHSPAKYFTDAELVALYEGRGE